jgi:hypothetical protein
MSKSQTIVHVASRLTLLFVLLTVSRPHAAAQPVRPHIYLPPTRGATVTSTYIDAQARYVVAMGDFLESAANARRHHAEALDRELDNSVKWVETFFIRRELNRKYRNQENPSYLERAKKREEVKDYLTRVLPEEELQSDVTDELNWLLNQLATEPAAYSSIYGPVNEYADSEIDHKLSLVDVGHIVLSDGGKYGHKLTFRAGDARVLEDRWPVAFRAPEMRAAREHYQNVRSKGLKEIQTKKELSYATWTEMQDALNDLETTFHKHFGHYRKGAPFQKWLLYDNGRRFVAAQELAIHRAMTTNQMEAFDGSYRFAGDSVFDLIRHMCRRGLNFSKPEAGDEGTYKKLWIAMRQIHLTLSDQG